MAAVTRRVVLMMRFDIEGCVIRNIACAALVCGSLALREGSYHVVRMLNLLRGRIRVKKKLPAPAMSHLVTDPAVLIRVTHNSGQ